MSQEEIEIQKAIAKFCNWTNVKFSEFLDLLIGEHKDSTTGMVYDYVNDFNALHEAEKFLSEQQWSLYITNLQQIAPTIKDLIHLTCYQKAQALVKAIST